MDANVQIFNKGVAYAVSIGGGGGAITNGTDTTLVYNGGTFTAVGGGGGRNGSANYEGVADQMDLLVALAEVLELTFKMSLMELQVEEMVDLEQLDKEMMAVMDLEAVVLWEAEAEAKTLLEILWVAMELVKNYSDIQTSNSHKVVWKLSQSRWRRRLWRWLWRIWSCLYYSQ